MLIALVGGAHARIHVGPGPGALPRTRGSTRPTPAGQEGFPKRRESKEKVDSKDLVHLWISEEKNPRLFLLLIIRGSLHPATQSRKCGAGECLALASGVWKSFLADKELRLQPCCSSPGQVATQAERPGQVSKTSTGRRTEETEERCPELERRQLHLRLRGGTSSAIAWSRFCC